MPFGLTPVKGVSCHYGAIRGLKMQGAEGTEKEKAKNEFDIREATTALRELSYFLERLEERHFPRSEEIKKAVQNSIKELCTGFLAQL